MHVKSPAASSLPSTASPNALLYGRRNEAWYPGVMADSRRYGARGNVMSAGKRGGMEPRKFTSLGALGAFVVSDPLNNLCMDTVTGGEWNCNLFREIRPDLHYEYPMPEGSSNPPIPAVASILTPAYCTANPAVAGCAAINALYPGYRAPSMFTGGGTVTPPTGASLSTRPPTPPPQQGEVVVPGGQLHTGAVERDQRGARAEDTLFGLPRNIVLMAAAGAAVLLLLRKQ